MAVPVAPPDTVERPLSAADEVICVETPPRFRAVGGVYDRFEQGSDERAVASLSTDEP